MKMKTTMAFAGYLKISQITAAPESFFESSSFQNRLKNCEAACIFNIEGTISLGDHRWVSSWVSCFCPCDIRAKLPLNLNTACEEKCKQTEGTAGAIGAIEI